MAALDVIARDLADRQIASSGRDHG